MQKLASPALRVSLAWCIDAMNIAEFFEKFELFADAPNAVAKMRELVLQLAMQGKLSEANDRDVPVSVLLRDIEVEKAMLGIKSAAMRLRENSENLEDEMPDAIPERWTLVRFGDIARHNAGKTLDKGRNSGVPRDYITTSNLYWGFFRLEDVRQMPIRDDELERCTAKKGDLLICEGGEAGRAAVWPHDYDISFQNHVHRARFYGGINPYFVQRFFEKLKVTGEIDKFRKGVGISNMSGKALASIVLPLPPLAEQKRIVAKVDELMALCDRLEAQQQECDARHAALARASLARFSEAPTPANLDFLFHPSYAITPADLRKSILTLAVQGKLVPQDANDGDARQMIDRAMEKRQQTIKKKSLRRKELDESSDLFERDDLPSSWCVERIANLVDPESTISYGVLVPGNDVSDGIPFVRAQDLSLSNHPARPNKTIAPEIEKPYARTRLTGGEILLCVVGSIGKLGVVPDSWAGANIARAVARIKPIPDVLRDYLLFVLQEQLVQNYFTSTTRTLAQPTLNVGMIEQTPIPVPPLAEQRRIVAKVDQLMVLVDQLETQLTASRATAAKLMEAVVAELTAQG